MITAFYQHLKIENSKTHEVPRVIIKGLMNLFRKIIKLLDRAEKKEYIRYIF